MAATPQNTERSTVAGGAKRSRSMPSRVVPPIELPASVDELARTAAAQLGWNGVVLPETTILGRKVCVVAKLRTDVHAERIAMGAGPVADRATVDTWTWPELAGTAPAPAAEIVGVLAVARHWRTAMASAVPFARYGEAAMVLPSPTVLTEVRSAAATIASASARSVAIGFSSRRCLPASAARTASVLEK